MVGVYFSGTGNTKHCLEQFVKAFDPTARSFSIEDITALKEIKQSEIIVFAYPIYFSNLPKIVRDFIEHNKNVFIDKKFLLFQLWDYLVVMGQV